MVLKLYSALKILLSPIPLSINGITPYLTFVLTIMLSKIVVSYIFNQIKQS